MLEQRVEGIVVTTDGAGVAESLPSPGFASPDFAHDHGDTLLTRLGECGVESIGVADGLRKQGYTTGRRHRQCVVDVLIHGGAELLTRGHREVEVTGYVAVRNQEHAARMRDQCNRARRVLGLHPHANETTRIEVRISHAVATADRRTRFPCDSAQALDQGGRSVALRHARIEDDKRPGPDVQSLFEGSFDAVPGQIEHGEFDLGG